MMVSSRVIRLCSRPNSPVIYSQSFTDSKAREFKLPGTRDTKSEDPSQAPDRPSGGLPIDVNIHHRLGQSALPRSF